MGWHGLLFVVIMEGPRLMDQPAFLIIWVPVPGRVRALEGLAFWPEGHTCHFCSHSSVGTNHKAPANPMG